MPLSTTTNQPQIGSQASQTQSSAQVAPAPSFTLPTINLPTVQDDLSVIYQDCTWRNISFPVATLTDSDSHRLVRHKFYNVNASKLENTGRESQTFSFQAIFCNICPTSKETWKQGTLFPRVFNQMVAALEDTSAGPFQHPFISGIITCQVVSFQKHWRNDWRGGAVIDIVLEETLADQQTNQLTKPTNPFAQDPALVASQIDNQLANQPSPGNPANFPFGIVLATALFEIANTPNYFTNLVNAVEQAISAPATIAGLAVQATTTCILSCKQLVQVIDGQNDPAYAQLRSNVVILQFLMQQQLQRLGATQPTGSATQAPTNPIIFYLTNAPTTLGHLTNLLSNTMDQLLSLNPQYAASPIIPANSGVRYYDLQ